MKKLSSLLTINGLVPTYVFSCTILSTIGYRGSLRFVKSSGTGTDLKSREVMECAIIGVVLYAPKGRNWGWKIGVGKLGLEN